MLCWIIVGELYGCVLVVVVEGMVVGVYVILVDIVD